ncbi:MAG: diaminopimelate epimerase [Alphaproteobacteria bacterium]|nr:diaminopimelate epimerase [Alphaproteobacteria bacterium]
MHFKKMHGLGNDFVIIDARTQSVTIGHARIQDICDRHFGVGCDLLALIEPSEKADVFARFYNADGSESAACGNASRCIADIVMKEQGAETCSLETGRGVLECTAAENGLVTVDMGAPQLDWADIPLAEERDTLMVELGTDTHNPAVAVGMGNPHCVLFVDDVENALVKRLGSTIEHHPLFPERTNVEFVQVLEDGRLRQRTWERGCGETLACGSGACAVGVAAIRRGLVEGRKVEIILNGGPIHIEWRESDGHVLMTGPVAYVFDGTIKNM